MVSFFFYFTVVVQWCYGEQVLFQELQTSCSDDATIGKLFFLDTVLSHKAQNIFSQLLGIFIFELQATDSW